MKRLLDLFCGAGGCSEGYRRAGFTPYGIDNDPKPLRHYPFPYACMDALEAMDKLLAGEGITLSNGETLYLEDFVAFHASPPCQGYSRMRHLPWLKSKNYPMLIDIVRERLKETSKPWVLENVMDSKLPAGWLCGTMFGYNFYRHRLFQSSFFWLQPGHPKHTFVIKPGKWFGNAGDLANKRVSICFPWMTKLEQRQAIPPVYTELEQRQAIPPVYTELEPVSYTHLTLPTKRIV